MDSFAVLGIDAAWTEQRPSGVALVECRAGRLTALAVAPSYEAFAEQAKGIRTEWAAKQSGKLCDAEILLTSAKSLTAAPVRCVAVDMPLSTKPITGRREADRQVSRQFGRNWCATHSPSPDRPGKVSTILVNGFERAGFSLATRDADEAAPKSLIEVYPHPALLRLTGEERRLPYKVSKLQRYKNGATVGERKKALFDTWRTIVAVLEDVVAGSNKLLPPSWEGLPTRGLKAFEDGLDALISAWVGAEFMLGRATAYGDDTAAIWVPEARFFNQGTA